MESVARNTVIATGIVMAVIMIMKDHQDFLVLPTTEKMRMMIMSLMIMIIVITVIMMMIPDVVQVVTTMADLKVITAVMITVTIAMVTEMVQEGHRMKEA
jgi:hypothetical protein